MDSVKKTRDIEPISMKEYNYPLTDNRIAKYPLEERDQSKLLVYQKGEIESKVFTSLPDLLQPKDCLVFNDTKVVHARMHFQKSTGAHIEVFCLEPSRPSEINEAFTAKGECTWLAMVGNAKRWKMNESIQKNIEIGDLSYQLHVELIEKAKDAYLVRFNWNADITFAEVLDDAGTLPLPPYLNRDVEAEDEERYQTLYAQADGSVAAPTAGLHFTQPVFDALEQKGIQTLFVTLHVGAGTFKPVKSATIQDHEMHRERINVSIQTIEKMLIATKEHRIIAIGTTSLRTIESIFWFGAKLLSTNEPIEEFFIGQWDPYELPVDNIEPEQALNAVIQWMRGKGHSHLKGSTQLLIAPGYRVKLADALITNFHQPQSTLLLLVSALIGEDWKRVYDYAMNNDYRFLSFGDSSVLFRTESE